ncbi:MAG: Rrf2 family transcriptional regulator [Proteobacteria bacterium]|jgi:Rrf2 family iron-sulfur cluster assembly transcriptional regulator|nr:Rrf2 family transcriptional regulator [Pseudomonadota bacterium]
MRLTTKGRFAVTAMLDVALHGGSAPVTLATISGRQKISLSYLEQLFGKLRRHGLVDSVRGPGGGYRLARDSAAISVADVIAAVDAPIDATPRGGEDHCTDDRCMPTHRLWAGLDAHILGYLQSVTLADLVRRSDEAGTTAIHASPREGGAHAEKMGGDAHPREPAAAV